MQISAQQSPNCLIFFNFSSTSLLGYVTLIFTVQFLFVRMRIMILPFFMEIHEIT